LQRLVFEIYVSILTPTPPHTRTQPHTHTQPGLKTNVRFVSRATSPNLDINPPTHTHTNTNTGLNAGGVFVCVLAEIIFLLKACM